MVKSTSIIEIPKALFEDDEVSIIRDEYIIEGGKVLPIKLINQLWIFYIPANYYGEIRRRIMG